VVGSSEGTESLSKITAVDGSESEVQGRRHDIQPMIFFWRFVRVTVACCLLAPRVEAHAQQVRSDWPDGWRDSAAHQSSVVRANGASLVVLDWGGAGPPLIMIDGLGGNAHAFDALAPLLRDRFRVIAYTRRGHGRSSKAGPFDTATLTEDLRQLLDSLRIDRVSLAGQSSAGNEITEFARQFPTRVAHVVYLDAVFHWGYPGGAAGYDRSRTPFPTNPFEGDTPEEAYRSFEAYRDWYLRTWMPTVRDPTVAEAYIRDLVEERRDGSVSELAPAAAMTAFSRGTAPRRYDGIQASVLAIIGETYLDTLGGPPDRRARYAAWEREQMQPFRQRSIAELLRTLPSARVVTVPGVHTDFYFTSRVAVAQLIREFAAPPD
jgi:pimeloyl-ACP methyl ester carboxylesterase